MELLSLTEVFEKKDKSVGFVFGMLRSCCRSGGDEKVEFELRGNIERNSFGVVGGVRSSTGDVGCSDLQINRSQFSQILVFSFLYSLFEMMYRSLVFGEFKG